MQILVVTEHKEGNIRKPSFEAISEARRIVDKTGGSVTALIMGIAAEGLSSQPAQYGADQVFVADVDNLNSDLIRDIVVQTVEKQGADVVFFTASSFGQDLAPRVAAKLEAGIASDCLELFVEEGKLEANRPLYAGKLIARVAVTTKVKIATLRPNLFEAGEADSSKSVPVEKINIPDTASKTTLKEFKSSGSTKMEITEADIIVSGGRGMQGSENFKMLEDLADLLGGAVGATRAAVDSDWRPHSEQVGQTGKTVTPTLYMIFGASGAIQHWAGMSGSKFIVAVNKDSEAPIIEKADYSIVGDLFEVLPALIDEVKKLRG